MGSSARGGDSDSEWSAQFESSVSSTNYTETDAGSHQEKDDLQELMGGLNRKASFKVAKGLLARMSSSRKLKRPGSRKGSSRRKWSTSHNQPNEADGSPNYLKATRSSQVRKVSSVSSVSSNDPEGRMMNRFEASGVRSKPVMAFRRTTSLRPVKILAKIPSLKPKRSSTRKCTEISSEVSDKSVCRATCSSAIKDSKFPAPVEGQQGGDVAEKISAVKVCSYSYCSLHGRHHHAAPTLKRLKSARKRVNYPRRSKLGGRLQGEGQAEKRFTEDISPGKDAGSKIGYGVDKVEEVAEKSPHRTTDLSSDERVCSEFSRTSRDERILGESEEEILECKTEIEEIPSRVKPKFASIGVQTDLELEDWGNKLCSSGELSQGDSTEEIGEDTDEARLVGRVFPVEELDSVQEKMEESFESPRETESTGESAEALSGSLGEISSSFKKDDEDLESLMDSEADSSISEDSSESSIGRRKYNGLWHLIYQQMVSDVAEKGGIESPVGREKEEEQVMCAEVLPNHDEASQQEELRQSDAVKLLHEAIGRILEQTKSGKFGKTDEDRSMVSENTRESDKEEEKMEGHEVVAKVEEKRRPNELASKRWSNLKKYILMRRFINAMEKTKNLGRNSIRRYPSSEVPSSDQEKVNLRRGMIGERKSAEEWMLDHALQKAVSRLDPAQKRRVALLVEAFETVNPTSGGKMAGDNRKNTDHAESPREGRVRGIQRDEIQSSNPQLASGDDSTYRKGSADIEIQRTRVPEDCMESKAVGASISSPPVDDEMKDRREADGGQKLMATDEQIEAVVKEEVNEESLPSVAGVGDEPLLEKKKYTGLWYLIYKQMASGLAREEGREPNDSPVDGVREAEEEDEVEDDKKSLTGGTESPPDSLESVRDVDSKEMKLQKIEAVKLVQQAIDKILLECKDGSTHNRDSNSNGVPEQESQEKSPETIIEADDAAPQNEERTTLQDAEKPNLRLGKNWKNVRKLIMLRRFVKTLETKVGGFNPREPRFLPLEPGVEPEKVNLRNRGMGERKSSEEYLLDYALQRVVSRLSPARRRKVDLLVEAFETITPSVGK